MVLRKTLQLSNSPINTRIKLLSITFFYNNFLTSTFKKYTEKATKLPDGIKAIIKNNHLIDSSISESVQKLHLKSTVLLSQSKLADYLQSYDLAIPLRHSKLVNDLKKFHLSFAISILVAPYLQFVLVTKIIALLIQDQWDTETNKLAKTLIKNLKFISSAEAHNMWLEFCYPNNYLSSTDKSGSYENLSYDSKSFIQSTINHRYGNNVNKFIKAFKNFSKSITPFERIQAIINDLYNKYILPYSLLFVLTAVILLVLVQEIFHVTIFTLLSIPLVLLSSYEITNNIMHSLIPRRRTLSLNAKNQLPTSFVAACIPFIVSSTYDLKRVRLEIEKLRKANTTYKYIKYFALIDFADSFDIDENEIIEMRKSLDELFKSMNQEGEIFYYFLRKSLYSEKQERYMGWERKRGKIVEFIKFLYKDKTKSTVYSNYQGDDSFKYLFTIDEGSQVSKEIIKELLLRAENINNQPIVSKNKAIVQQGYGIFQPKISSKQDFNRTLFQKLFNKFEKYHVYAATEDITFSMLGEYYYQGKGLINIDMYREICIDRFPDDVLLSHDLIEGNYLRVAHVDECTIFESFPRSFDSYLQRSNRWMRGDINSILWLRPGNDTNTITKIRIIINLLNILKAPLIILSPLFLSMPIPGLVIGWGLSELSWIFSLIKEFFFFIFQKHTLSFKCAILSKRLDYWKIYEFISLPLNATNSIYAMIASFIRLSITKSHTLTWVSSRNTEKISKAISSSLMLKLALLLLLITLFDLKYGLILIILSICSIIISKLLNKKIKLKEDLAIIDKKYLKKITNLTWNFFEKYVNTDTHYLPPDNVTKGEFSQYTSITNIGFYFLSLVCANNLGLIDDKKFFHYFKRSFNTLTKLPKYKGYFYNWYNISTLKVLEPNFISSVDLGNFYACMVCTRQYMQKLGIGNSYLDKIDIMLSQIKFSFFMNKFNQLSIGYDVKKKSLSNDNYEYLASEARIAVYIAVATEDIPEDAWGNLLRPFNRDGALLSWGGTVFEYLLPQLFLKTYTGSLTGRSFKSLLSSNIHFAHEFHIPWGVSESLYVDELTKKYEYKPIGISTLSRDPLQIQRTTITPYATSLMCLIDSKKAIANLKALEALNSLTEYGFFESMTFSKASEHLEIDSFMSHHQGMIMASLTNVLMPDILVKLFNSYSTFETVDYLLDEDIPYYPEIINVKALKFSIDED